ncbi:hypothetical protein [Flavobacterium davisii]|uniref:hypothetical protein n=1 Tax=Flavobacterium davisii TaxID=2906077 RepID=UPI0035D09591
MYRFNNASFIKTSILFFLLLYNYCVNSFRTEIYSVNNFFLNIVADIGNNIVFIPITFLLCEIFNYKFFKSFSNEILFHFFLLSLVEILSFFVKGIGTFDLKDIFGLSVGGLLIFLMVKYKIIINDSITETTD